MDKTKADKANSELTREKAAMLERENRELKQQLSDLNSSKTTAERNLKGLLNATFSILETNNFNVTARNIFDSCARVIGAGAGYVALLSDDGAENELLFLEDGGLPCTVNPDLPMPIRGLRAEAYMSGKVVFDNNFMNSEWIKFMPGGHLDLPNVLFAPLNVQGKTVGIMGFANKEGDFTEEDAEIAAAFGEYAAIALQNSQFVESLEKRNLELDELNATKDRFFSIIAHDLKSPLIAIMGLSSMLDEDLPEQDTEKIQYFITNINKSAKHSFNLLDNLLQWAGVQTGKIEFKPENVCISEVVDNTLSLFSTNISQKELVIIKQIDPALSFTLDVMMLETILRNLIANAIKYSNQGGDIEISALIEVERLVLSVKDKGIGIEPENIEQLFKIEKGFKMPGVNQEKGTGLGLIICREFIEMHKGSIRAESTPGKGSKFIISIPVL